MLLRSLGVSVFIISASMQMSGAGGWWAWKRYTVELKNLCPAKHLEWMPYGELPDVIDDFSTRLTASDLKRVEAAEADRCKDVQMGASCGNEGFLRVMIEQSRLREFADFVCALPERCTAQSECKQD